MHTREYRGYPLLPEVSVRGRTASAPCRGLPEVSRCRPDQLSEAGGKERGDVTAESLVSCGLSCGLSRVLTAGTLPLGDEADSEGTTSCPGGEKPA